MYCYGINHHTQDRFIDHYLVPHFQPSRDPEHVRYHYKLKESPGCACLSISHLGATLSYGIMVDSYARQLLWSEWPYHTNPTALMNLALLIETG